MKNPIMQLTDFLNGPCLICYIILHEDKVTSYEKFSHNLTVEVQIVWKISEF